MKRIAILSLPGRGARDEFLPLTSNASMDARWVRFGDARPYASDKAVDERGRRWSDFEHYSDAFARGVDMFILPGSRLTMLDLQYLRESGAERILRQHLADGGIIVGVCGGYQILGTKLYDPLQKQGGAKQADGFGLLPIRTLFGPRLIECTTTANCLLAPPPDKTVSGVEHRSGFSWVDSGHRRYRRLNKVTRRELVKPLPPKDKQLLPGVIWAPGTERYDGFVSRDHQIWGTYFHLIFHSQPFCRAVFGSR